MVTTSKAKILLIVILSVILIPITPSTSSYSGSETKVNSAHLSIFDYVWMWEEYNNAPGDVVGDEPIIWGGSFFHLE